MLPELRIACVGDIMMGDSFYAMNQGVASSIRKWGSDFLHEDIVRYLKQHDLVLCNVECVLSDVGANRFSLRKTQMRGRPQDAALLKQWGFNVANVANNHILEHGLGAAVDTVVNLKNCGLDVIGAGQNEDFKDGITKVCLSLKGHKISILGACLRNEKYAHYNTDHNEALLDLVKETSQDSTTIVSIHWGDELIDRPSISTKSYAKQLRDAGAVIIAGHHPHVLQGIEDHDGSITAYSLGNFIFNGFLRDTCWSAIISVTLSEHKVKKWEYRLVEKDKDHRPHFCEHQRLSELTEETERRIELLKDSSDSQEYELKYRKELLELKKQASSQLYKLIAKSFFTYKPIYLPQILLRPIKRRLKLW